MAHFTRRQALTVLGAAGLQAASKYQPKIAAQLYVWTQYFNRQKKPLAEGLDEIFASTRRAGYTRLEVVSQFVEPDLLPRSAALAKQHGLEIPIVYAAGPYHDEAAAPKTVENVLRIAAAAKSIGARYINTNATPKPKKEPKTDVELDLQARSIGKLARSLNELGMHLLLHHHDAEMAQNAREWRHLLRNTEPKHVSICLDVDWIVRGGQKPAEIVREAGTRVLDYHLRSSRSGVWTEAVGDGDYDYAQLAEQLRGAGFEGYLVVELAIEKGTAGTRSLEENLRASREYVEKTFAVR